MRILGVANAADSGAALLVDGKVIAAANEERFVRKKLIRCFPAESIRYVLEAGGLNVQDIDWVGCGCWHGIDEARTLPLLIEDVFDQMDHEESNTRTQILDRVKVSASRDAEFRDELLTNLVAMGFPRERIHLCDHHYSHAITAFYPGPFQDAYVLTADGRGDFRSVTLWKASRKDGLELVDMATDLTSPGALYGFITKYLGFTPDRHEGKVTGLAAFGHMTEAYDVLKSGLFFDAETGRLRSRIGSVYRPFMAADLDALAERLAPFTREEVAFAVQKLLEDNLKAFLLHNLKGCADGSVNLCLAGGCMGNVKLNYELNKLAPIRDIYVFPGMGDGGNAVGGAISAAVQYSGLSEVDMRTVYLGPEYSNEELEAEFKKEGLDYQRLEPGSKASTAAQMMADGLIIGWYQGRMEFGPRALGSRSILASATDASINDSLNERLQRTEFMPFAPVTIDEYAERCFVGWKPEHRAAQFMTTCYDCTPFLAERSPAVVHIDNTARPQVVFREDNPDYYDCIKAYVELTGNPTLINTSFNHHEEPIVNTPYDAVRSLKKGNVDVLIAGDFAVRVAG